MKHSSRQSGSAFVLILMAVAMFAALSYAVSQGTRTSISGMSNDQAKLAAQEIIAYGNTIAGAVQKLKLQGCSDNQFDFANTNWVRQNGDIMYPPGSNPQAPASGCNIFTDGKIQPVVMPQTYLASDIVTPVPTSPGYGVPRVIELGIPKIGDTAKEDIVYRQLWIKKDICEKINSILGIGLTNIASLGSMIAYNGNFADTYFLSDPQGTVAGKTAFCIQHGTEYSFLQVLVAR